MNITNVEFKFNIDSANAAVVDDHRSEIADALEATARKIRECYDKGVITDSNGNKIGSWNLDIEEDEEDEEG